jgi:hypothetical protein
MSNEKKARAIDRVWKDKDLIGLIVTLKSKTGRSLKEQGLRVTQNNLEYFVPPPQRIRDAKKILRKAGFKIIAESRLGLSILGEKQLIEKYFNAKIDVKTVKLKHGKETTKIRMPKANLKLPKELSAIVDRVKFEQYPIPLESATPPSVDYYHLNVPDDIVDILNVQGCHDAGKKGAGIKICMLDDGFFEHAYYAGRGYNITTIPVGGLSVIPEGKGHGTAIATNALAIAPECEFVVMNAMILIFSIATAAFRRAKEENPDIITCSWGLSDYDEDLAWEIADAVNQGIVVVFACGNEGPILFPGCMDEVISVGGVFPEEGGGFHASTYASSGECSSNPGRQCPDVCGLVGDSDHGVLIMMPTVPDGNFDNTFGAYDETAADDGWLCASGTSSAAPQVAGIAALLIQCDPTLTPAQVKTTLQNTAIDIIVGSSASGEAAGVGVDLATGSGLVNAAAAMEAVGCDCDGFCVWYREFCLWRFEHGFCVYARETGCILKLEFKPIPCRITVETCRISFMVDPGGCGPVSLIAEDFDRWRINERFDGMVLTAAARHRLSRFYSLPTRKRSLKKISARRRPNPRMKR